MKHRNWLLLAMGLAAAPSAFSATKDQEPPDKEMLKMMELLREMEMIKQVDMMQDLHHVEAVGEQAKSATPQKRTPAPKKETPK